MILLQATYPEYEVADEPTVMLGFESWSTFCIFLVVAMGSLFFIFTLGKLRTGDGNELFGYRDEEKWHHKVWNHGFALFLGVTAGSIMFSTIPSVGKSASIPISVIILYVVASYSGYMRFREKRTS